MRDPHLGDERSEAHNARDVESIQKALDLGNARARSKGFEMAERIGDAGIRRHRGGG